MSAHNTIRTFMRVSVATCGVLAAGFALAVTSSTAMLIYPTAPTATFGTAGSSDGQFTGPLGVAVDDASNDVYVVDQGNDRVEKFDAQGTYLSQFNGGETPAGAFSEAHSVAVDNASDLEKGDVYVTDVGHKVIDVFNPSGKYVSRIVGTPSSFAGELKGVAVDGSGNVWAYESNGSGNVDEFSDTGAFLATFNTERETTPGFAVDSNSDVYVLYGSQAVGKYTSTGTKLAEWGNGVALAVRQSSNSVFLDTAGKIDEYGPFAEPYGTLVQEFGAGGAGLSGSDGLAVNDTTATLYASESAADVVAIFKQVVVPDVAPVASSNIAPTAVTLNGTVNPDGETITACEFEYNTTEYGATETYAFTVPCSSRPSGASAVPVSANVTGLKKGTSYHYRLVVADANGSNETVDSGFATSGEAPVVVGPPGAVEMTTQTVLLTGALVSEGGLATTYHYEYGTTSAYGLSTPELELAHGEESPLPPVLLEGLSAGTTYHYKLVLKNSLGTVMSADQTFTTESLTAPLVSTGVGTGTTPASATLSGIVDPQGWSGAYGFEIGTGVGYTEQIVLGTFGPGTSGSQALSQSVALLEPSTTYHFRAYFTTEAFGTLYGADQTFTTPAYTNPLSIAPPPPFVSASTIAFPSEEKASVVKKTTKKGKTPKVKHKRKKKTKAKRKKK